MAGSQEVGTWQTDSPAHITTDTNALAIMHLVDTTKPNVVVLQNGPMQFAYLVFERSAEHVAVFLTQTVGGRCPGDLIIEVASSLGARVHLRGNEMSEGGYDTRCHGGSSDIGHVCSAKEQADDKVVKYTGCFRSIRDTTQYVVNLETGAVEVMLTAPAPKVAGATAELIATGLRLAGRTPAGACAGALRFAE
jgi:hypothetical protein